LAQFQRITTAQWDNADVAMTDGVNVEENTNSDVSDEAVCLDYFYDLRVIFFFSPYLKGLFQLH
jgi:hypothetical protein